MAWFRNYYQQEFGDRVRNVVKGGAAPTPPRTPSGSGGGKGGGVAVFFVVALVLAVIRGMSSSSGYRPPPRIEVPHFDPPRFNPPQFNPPRIEVPPADLDQRWRELDRRFDQMRDLDPDARERLRKILEEPRDLPDPPEGDRPGD